MGGAGASGPEVEAWSAGRVRRAPRTHCTARFSSAGFMAGVWFGCGPTTVLTVDEAVDAIGHVPLPPYIKRDDRDADRDRYQTIFARSRGSIAAPTAGLHFTPAIVAACAARGVEIAEITLHVGYGTFQPVRVEQVEDHRDRAGALRDRSRGRGRDQRRRWPRGRRDRRRRHDDDAHARSRRARARRPDRRRHWDGPTCSSIRASSFASCPGC